MLGVPSEATRSRMRVRPSGSRKRNTADLSESRSIDARVCSFMGYFAITAAMAFCFSGHLTWRGPFYMLKTLPVSSA
jgi:hypothetical protein